jgi:hypothetical protein
MKIIPVKGAGDVQDKSTPEHVRTAKAVEAFQKGQSSYDKQTPVPVNANAISAEEIGAVRQAQQETQEPPAKEAAPPEEVKAEEPSSSQMAILARKERALRAQKQQQDQAFKSREAALAAREAAVEAKASEYNSGYIPKASLKQAALEALSSDSKFYEEMTQQVINNQTPLDPRVSSLVNQLNSQVKDLEAKLEAQTKGQVEQQTAAYQSAVAQIKADVTALVNSDPNFETVKSTRSVSDVVELIEKTYAEEKRLLSVEEASQLVEDYLVDEALKLANIGKIKKRLSAAPAVQAKAETQTPTTKQPQTMKTLTNATASTRQLSAKERAILAFKGELKS